MPETFSTAEVSEISGLTLRQLQWFDESGILPPDRKNWHGRERRYGERELFGALVLADLRRRKFPFKTTRRVMTLSVHFPTDGVIVADNRKAVLKRTSDLATEAGRRGMVAIIALDPLLEKLRSTAHKSNQV